MSQELMYTSAPKGLKPGSRGFCTVVSTQGMAVNLSERLESLSGYRHVFQPNDPQAGLNPVVYSHLKLVVGGRSVHVLSRICAAGLDYTQRTNKFAHHVVLDDTELPPAGPAWLLQQPGFMATAWDGQTRILPGGRRPPVGQVGPGVCRAWSQLTGDAGWGGVLAETAINSRSGATVAFQPGTELLSLVAESIALLPPERRWDATFSTYYTKLPPGVDCDWRFVVAGSPEAAARFPGVTFIDLSRQIGQPIEGSWITAARTGVIHRANATNVQAQNANLLPTNRDSDVELQRLLAEEAAAKRTSVAVPSPAPVAEPFSAHNRPPLPGATAANQVSTSPKFKSKDQSRRLWYVAVAALLLILVAGGIAAVVADRRDNSDADPQKVAETSSRVARGGDPTKEAAEANNINPEGTTTLQAKPGDSNADDDKTEKSTVGDDNTAKLATDDGNANEAAEVSHEDKRGYGKTESDKGEKHEARDGNAREAVDEVKADGRQAENGKTDERKMGTGNPEDRVIESLPPLGGTLTKPARPDSTPFEICSDLPSSPITIELLGGDKILSIGGYSIQLRPEGGQLTTADSVDVGMYQRDFVTFGKFSIDKDKLVFTWTDVTVPRCELLKNCVLRVTVSHEEGEAMPEVMHFALRSCEKHYVAKPLLRIIPELARQFKVSPRSHKTLRLIPQAEGVGIGNLPGNGLLLIDQLKLEIANTSPRLRIMSSEPVRDGGATKIDVKVSAVDRECPDLLLTMRFIPESGRVKYEYVDMSAPLDDLIHERLRNMYRNLGSTDEAPTNWNAASVYWAPRNDYTDEGSRWLEETISKRILDKRAQETEQETLNNARARRAAFKDSLAALTLGTLEFRISYEFDESERRYRVPLAEVLATYKDNSN